MRTFDEYSKTSVCEYNSFRKHACNPKYLYIKGNFKNHWLTCDHVMFSVTYTTRIARHRLFIKLKFIRNVCLSCRTLTEQVTHNPKFYRNESLTSGPTSSATQLPSVLSYQLSVLISQVLCILLLRVDTCDL